MGALGGLDTYAPLGVLKPLGRGLWMVDGPVVKARTLLGAVPLTTRMTVARLPDGRLWLHAPVELSVGLEREVRALGRVAALVAPSRLCAGALRAWQASFPRALTWAAPGLGSAAERCGFRVDGELACGAPPPAWGGEFAQVLVPAARRSEAAFLHRPSRTLVLSDLVHNFEEERRGGLRRLVAPRGGTRRDLRLAALWRRRELRSAVETILGWRPDRVIPAHGQPWLRDGTAELRRALAWIGVQE